MELKRCSMLAIVCSFFLLIVLNGIETEKLADSKDSHLLLIVLNGIETFVRHMNASFP